MNAIMQKPLKQFGFSKQIAHDLLQLGAVKLNVKEPFTWVSGIKGPIYCDNRVVNSDPKIRRRVVDAFVELIKEKFSDVEVIAGIVTGGLPFGSLIADRLNLPFIYVRQQAKEHGLKKQVEGFYIKGAKVVVIEDHISTGGSSIVAIEALQHEQLQILGLVSIMTYGFEKAIKAFSEHHIDQYSLCDLDIILDVALEESRINSADKDSILAFRGSPERWFPVQ